jgi:hypothetical protein
MVLNLLIDNPAIRVIGPQVFPFMRVVKLVRTGVKITNSTNPITVVGNVTLTVLDCCAPPPLRLAATCAASSTVAPNPISVGATLHFASQIYDNC